MCSIEFFHVLQVVLLEYALKTAVILPWCPIQSVAHSCGSGHGYQLVGITNTLYHHGYASLKMPSAGVLTTLRSKWNSFMMFLRCFWCTLLTSCFIPVVGHYIHFVKITLEGKNEDHCFFQTWFSKLWPSWQMQHLWWSWLFKEGILSDGNL